MSQARISIDVHYRPDAADRTMAAEIREGLGSRPKSLPPKYFYDERGSELFERITELPEYYPTRAERALLEEASSEIARLARPQDVVELGSGAAKKTRLLLDAAWNEGRLGRYVPFDVAREMAEDSARVVAERYDGIRVHAVVGDFHQHLDEIPEGEDRLFAFLGSTIGNFERSQAIEFLGDLADIMNETDRLLLGTDLVKDVEVLEAAYNDSEGVTAEFNKNVLRVLNEKVEADFDLDTFEHDAFFAPEEQRIEMHLRSNREQCVRLRGLDLEVPFERGESVRTEVSCKYTEDSVRAILENAGLELDRWFTGPDRAFGLSLASKR